MLKVWPFTVNLLLFGSFAFVGPYLVLFYQGLGFTGAQIGLLTGLSPLVTLFAAPLWTGLADATGRHRLLMGLALLGGAICTFAFPLVSAFAPILVIALFFNAFFAPVSSFIDSATMVMLGDEKELYGRVRLGGTIGFGIAASLAGVLIQNYGLKLAFWVCTALVLLAGITSQKLVHSQRKTSDTAGGGARTLLANRRWLLFLMVAFAGGLSLTAANSYFFPYLRMLGANESTMGFSLTLGTLSEVPVLFFGHHLLKRFKPYGLLMLAMIVTGVRLMLFAAAGQPGFALVLQLFSGLTFPAFQVAGVAYADENAPPGLRTTAQGLFGAMVFGVGAAVGGLIGGPVLEVLGGRVLYLTFGGVVLAVVASAMLIQKRLSSELATSPNGV